MNIPTDTWLHIPANSGIRLRAGDPRISEIGSLAVPLVVLETDGGFQPVWSTSRLRFCPADDGLSFEAEGLTCPDTCDTLQAAVGAYRQAHPLPVKIGPERPRRFARAVTLDLWHPDGRILHTYDDARSLVRDLADRGLADGTLLYLPGWSAPYDMGYPQYRPADELGGPVGFRSLVDKARGLGTTVMPHLNFWAYDASSGLLPNHREFQVRGPDGTPMEWPGVLRPGFTNPLAYMRVDDRRWTDVFFSYVDPLISDFGLQAVYLDQIGHDVDEGIVSGSQAMLEHIHTEHPCLTVGAELLIDFLVPYVDVMQAWGMPWSGIMVDFSQDFSPIARLLYQNSLVFISHIGQPCAVPAPACWANYPFITEKGHAAAFKMSQSHNRDVGCVPHIRIAYRSHGLDAESMRIFEEGNAS